MNTKYKKAGVAIVISDETDLETEDFTKQKELSIIRK